ncbi:HK97 family phage major capsid protein [Desulfobotulus alkaliphilus]|uniref:HK97 family phage major capsid protein n=1 Tax=Desulfobotulus alkaliphilus TaxID=622671 RepID=A0A562S861_9BACT|nr:phage major capsid protein [Desulfobotulus alkaliphilus]TWI77373.1 HK97 family phage major capsid protein [Desulfobotulus alkaliphilus]
MKRQQLTRAQEKLGQTWDEYKSYRDGLPDDEKRWTGEQLEKFDRFDSAIDGLEGEIERLKRSIRDEEREERFSQSGDPWAGEHGGHGYGGLGAPIGESRSGGKPFGMEADRQEQFDFRSNPSGNTKRHSFNRYLLDGSRAIGADEFRSLQAGSDVSGGFLNAPEVFVKKLLKSLDDEIFIRKLATNYPVPHSVSLGCPVLDSDLADCEWTAELKTGSEDKGLGFGKRELRPYPTAKRVLVSNKILRTAALNPEDLVRERLVYKLGATEEKAFMTGDGHNKPLGLFTPSTDGISTARDVKGSNTATAITADTLIDVVYSVKASYAKKAVWIFNREAIRRIRKLKDNDGQYLWQRGLAGAPDTILERPYHISEHCPGDFSAGKYVGLFGDLSFYWIATGLAVHVKRLDELYAEQNMTGFIGRLEVDGMPVMEDAFARIKLASS